MATSLTNTGIQFPDNTVQTTAATGSGGVVTYFNLVPNSNTLLLTGISPTAKYISLTVNVMGATAPTSRYPFTKVFNQNGTSAGLVRHSSYRWNGASSNPISNNIGARMVFNTSDGENLTCTDHSATSSGGYLVRIYYVYETSGPVYHYQYQYFGGDAGNTTYVGPQPEGNGYFSIAGSRLGQIQLAVDAAAATNTLVNPLTLNASCTGAVTTYS